MCLFSKVRDLALAFVTSTNSPFSIIQSKAFLELVDYVSSSRASIPVTKTLMSDLNEKYEEAKAKLKNLLAKAKYICITADVWTSKAKSFLGVSVHFFDDMMERKSFLLAFRRITGRHTYDVLAQAILSIQKEFNIKRKNITHIVTDGASNFKKMFVVYGPNEQTNERNCESSATTSTEEEMELEIEDVLAPESDENQMYFPPETTYEVLVLENPESNEDDDFSYDDCEDFTKLPKQMRCIAHTLNLLGTNDFEKMLKLASPKCAEALSSGYSKLKKFWQLNSRSTVVHEPIQRVCKRSFPHPNTTRWNSKFDAISIAEKHRTVIKEAIDEINMEVSTHNKSRNKAKTLEQISALEWKLLKDYVTVLKPVAEALDILQGDKRSCQGFILPTLYGIQAALDENLIERKFVSDYGIVMNAYKTAFHSGLVKLWNLMMRIKI